MTGFIDGLSVGVRERRVRGDVCFWVFGLSNWVNDGGNEKRCGFWSMGRDGYERFFVGCVNSLSCLLDFEVEMLSRVL